MDKLAKCKLCGIEPERHYDTDFDPPLLSVGCECCGMGTPHLRQASAEKVWNDHMVKKDAAPGWISVKDRLPEDGERVLVTECGRVFVERFDRLLGFDTPTTHWMPLPQPPKEERDE